MYRRRHGAVEILLVHPGGPYWKNKDINAWSMPKGEFGDDEALLAAACREFEEETGFLPSGTPASLGEFRASGKVIHAFALEGDWDSAKLDSNTFEMEWPPRLGRTRMFPEADRAAWFTLPTAREKIHKGQDGILDALEVYLSGRGRR